MVGIKGVEAPRRPKKKICLFCLQTDAFTPLFPPLQAMDKASKGIDSVSDRAKSGIDQADAKFKKAQADAEVRRRVGRCC